MNAIHIQQQKKVLNKANLNEIMSSHEITSVEKVIVMNFLGIIGYKDHDKSVRRESRSFERIEDKGFHTYMSMEYKNDGLKATGSSLQLHLMKSYIR